MAKRKLKVTAANYYRTLKGVPHAHSCLRCHVRYEDNCLDTEEDGMCWLCWTDGERRLPWWPENWLPRECCRTDSKRLDQTYKGDREVLARYRLVGLHNWWRCKTCARTFGYDPSKDYRPAITQVEWMERNRT